jgi:hypothetical protein
MAPTDTRKWAVLTELTQTHFTNDEGMSNATRLAVELAGQHPTSVATFVAAMEAAAAAKKVEALVRTSAPVLVRPSSRDAVAVAAVLEVVEDAARHAVALLQSQSTDMATVGSTTGPSSSHTAPPTMRPWRRPTWLVWSCRRRRRMVPAMTSRPCSVTMTMTATTITSTTDEKVALMASFETAHREEVTRKFMAAEREALAAMLAVCACAAKEATRVVDEEEAVREVAAAERPARRRRPWRRWPGTRHAGTRTW